MKVGVTPVWSLIKEATPAEMKAASEVLQVGNPAYWGAKRRGVSVLKKLSLFKNGSTRIFPTGYLEVLKRELAKLKMTVEVVQDARKTLTWREPTKDMISLPEGKEIDDEQLKAVRLSLERRTGFTRAITAWGKTEALLLKYACLKPVRALLLTPRAGLHRQALARIQEELKGEPLQQIRGGKVNLPDTGLVVTTFATLASRLGIDVQNPNRRGPKKKAAPIADPDVVAWVKGVDLLLVDECHRATGNTALPVLQAVPASYRMGVSATPMLDGNTWKNALLKGFLGWQLFRANEKKALEAGRISAVHYWVRKIGEDDPMEMAEVATWDQVYRESIVQYTPLYRQIIRDVNWLYKQDLPTVILVDWTEHGAKVKAVLEHVFPDRKIGFIHGDLPAAEFEAIKQGFIDEEFKILVASPVLNEGINIPNISGLLICGSSKAAHKMIQQAGRGNRAKPGRPNVLYLVAYLHLRHFMTKRHAIKLLKTFAKQRTYFPHGTGPLEVIPG